MMGSVVEYVLRRVGDSTHGPTMISSMVSSVLRREYPWRNHDDLHGLICSERKESMAHPENIHDLSHSGKSERENPWPNDGSPLSHPLREENIQCPTMMTSMV